MFAIGMTLLVMAACFFGASFLNEDLSHGDAGTVLARLFAATLGISALMAFLMGLLLLRDDRKQLDHYRTPLALGLGIGIIESWLFLAAAPALFLVVPLFLLIFALRPLRERIAKRFEPARKFQK
jgi:hypothetical protein